MGDEEFAFVGRLPQTADSTHFRSARLLFWQT
jgi:hypothetical protein